MRRDRLLLAAYFCSGVAGMIYETSWTRLLTLYMGHSTAATATVVAALMGGLGIGALAGGRFYAQLRPRAALTAFAWLELGVLVCALLIPVELGWLRSLLGAAYDDGRSSTLFPLVRLIACLVALLPPAVMMGATFPVAVMSVLTPGQAERGAAAIYAANTAGAAIGAAVAGFVLLPMLGLWGTTVAAAALSSAAIFLALRQRGSASTGVTDGHVEPTEEKSRSSKSPGKVLDKRGEAAPVWLSALVGCLSGCAVLILEISWMRLIALIIGPSTYAFAIVLAAIVAGMAVGSYLAFRVDRRFHANAPAMLVTVLAVTGLITALAHLWAASQLPRMIAEDLTTRSPTYVGLLIRTCALLVGLLHPIAVGLGAVFPLALAIVAPRKATPDTFARIYAVNAFGAVIGTLLAGFWLIPLVGLRRTFDVAVGLLFVAALAIVARMRLGVGMRMMPLAAAAMFVALAVAGPQWNRDLLASGTYKYARSQPGFDLDAFLAAGTLLYYRDGAVATVSVEQLTGTTSLAIDGKIDASTGADMLTQKLLAHLPLLVRGGAHDVCLIGLGSGITLGSVLTHDVTAVDVVELSPEVVEASAYFEAENHGALADPRTRVIEGDGRSHILLSSQQYDVIISEPSNPWMAGIAALFTQEFFSSVRNRLTLDGVFCQWAHTYDIDEQDLRSIVGTFLSVFPNGTMWLVGNGDLLLIGSASAAAPRLDNIVETWGRDRAIADLKTVGVVDPLQIVSMYVGGPAELSQYATGAAIQTDNRMALEFTGPRALYGTSDRNVDTLSALAGRAVRPDAEKRAPLDASPGFLRARGEMLFEADAFAEALRDYAHAVERDPTNMAGLRGVVQAAVAAHQEGSTLQLLDTIGRDEPSNVRVRVARSRLLAATGEHEAAVRAAREAIAIAPDNVDALEQLASILADAGDLAGLEPVIATLGQLAPEHAPFHYYHGVAGLMRGDLGGALTSASEAIRVDRGYAAAHTLLGVVHASLGQLDAAREALETSKTLDPRDTGPYINLGNMNLDAANWSAAAANFADALSLDPNSVSARQGFEQARSRLRP